MQLKRPPQLALRIARSIASAGAVALISAAFTFISWDSLTTVTLIFTFAILCAATWWGLAEALTGAVAAAILLVYYFIPPVHAFKVADVND